VRRSIAIGAALVAAAATPAAASASCPGQDVRPTAATAHEVAGAVVCLLNEERTAAGLDRVRGDAGLRGDARRYAQLMVDEHFFGHRAPDGDDLDRRAARSAFARGSRRWVVGENLAWGTGGRATAAATVAGWMASAPHRRNVLDPRWRVVGLGLALGTPRRGLTGGATFTAHFGRHAG
jgi:uncharacterized protein YkwD